MIDPTRRQLLGYLAVGLAVVTVGALWMHGGARPGPAVAAGSEPVPPAITVDDGRAGAVVVHVAGAVRRPGVYRLRDGTRVTAAIRRAGGATRRADLDGLNLAARLSDGRQVVVPTRVRAAPGTSAGAGAPAPAASVPVNLNSATVGELDALDGIGPTTAQSIIEYREEHGGFASVDELDRVPGIGPQRLEGLRDRVTA